MAQGQRAAWTRSYPPLRPGRGNRESCRKRNRSPWISPTFSATFPTGEKHSIGEELDLARAYLAIEQTRFRERLQLEWDVADALNVQMQVPALILQPLVENAIQHGIAPARDGGRVWVRARREDSTIAIHIGNSVDEETGHGTRTAGDDVRVRLRHCFGNRARCEVHTEPGHFK